MRTCEKHGIAYKRYHKQGERDCPACAFETEIHRHEKCAEGLRELLKEATEGFWEIEKGVGAFDLDPLSHARNTIEDMKLIARTVRAKIEGRS
jgi:CRISPR/Cas system-associated protein Cas10 (large subunit of type III CRISPR-Cas system)